MQVKGKHRAVRIFQPLAPGTEGTVKAQAASEETETLWTDMLQYYRTGNADAAQEALERLRRIGPDSRLFALYAERITMLRQLPEGATWDGITRFDSK